MAIIRKTENRAGETKKRELGIDILAAHCYTFESLTYYGGVVAGKAKHRYNRNFQGEAVSAPEPQLRLNVGLDNCGDSCII
jgi:hypothetical protein